MSLWETDPLTHHREPSQAWAGSGQQRLLAGGHSSWCGGQSRVVDSGTWPWPSLIQRGQACNSEDRDLLQRTAWRASIQCGWTRSCVLFSTDHPRRSRSAGPGSCCWPQIRAWKQPCSLEKAFCSQDLCEKSQLAGIRLHGAATPPNWSDWSDPWCLVQFLTFNRAWWEDRVFQMQH